MPPGIPTSEMIENIVAKEIKDDEIPIISEEVIFDNIIQNRNPETIIFSASTYKYNAPVPTVFRFIIIPFLMLLN
jgi:hypothetical protein